jgi:hypothetical protein
LIPAPVAGRSDVQTRRMCRSRYKRGKRPQSSHASTTASKLAKLPGSTGLRHPAVVRLSAVFGPAFIPISNKIGRFSERRQDSPRFRSCQSSTEDTGGRWCQTGHESSPVSGPVFLHGVYLPEKSWIVGSWMFRLWLLSRFRSWRTISHLTAPGAVEGNRARPDGQMTDASQPRPGHHSR